MEDVLSELLQKIVNICDIVSDNSEKKCDNNELLLCELRLSTSMLSDFVHDLQSKNADLTADCSTKNRKLQSCVHLIEVEREAASARVASLQRVIQNMQDRLSLQIKQLELKSVWGSVINSCSCDESNSSAELQCNHCDEVSRVLTWLSLSACRQTQNGKSSIAAAMASIINEGVCKVNKSVVLLQQENAILRARLHEVAAKEADTAHQLEFSQRRVEALQLQLQDMQSAERQRKEEMDQKANAIEENQREIMTLTAKIKQLEAALDSAAEESNVWKENCSMLLDAIEPISFANSTCSEPSAVLSSLDYKNSIVCGSRARPNASSLTSNHMCNGLIIKKRLVSSKTNEYQREISPIRRARDDSICDVPSDEDDSKTLHV